MIVYWIRKKYHTDIYKQGYVGITKTTLKERVRSHKKNKSNSIVAGKIRKHNDLVYEVIHTVDTLDEALELEALYRPVQNIGWNLQAGGVIGVESGWYKIQENSLRHSKKTSEATRRGIAAKDTREARSERAKKNHRDNPEKYKDASIGERNSRAILSEANVVEIKYRLFPKGLSNPEIADMFGVKPYVISFIRTGKNWKHV